MSETTAARTQNTTDQSSGEGGQAARDQRQAETKMPDPTDTDHPTGEAQAAENAATESPS